MTHSQHAAVSAMIDTESGPFSTIVIVLTVLLALALQVFLPVYIDFFGLFDLPLLVLAYTALLGRSVLGGLLIGAAVGLAQDGLTHGPVGLFGIVKSVIGYLAATASLLVEVDITGVRSVLVALLFLVHQTLFWVIDRFLLGNPAELDVTRSIVLATAHAGLALIVFRLLDRIKRPN